MVPALNPMAGSVAPYAPTRDEESLDDEIAALEAEEARLAALARERAERQVKAKADAEEGEFEKLELRASLTSAKARSVREAKAILQELAKVRAAERAAAEESIRKAREVQGNESPPQAVSEERTAAPARRSWFPKFNFGKVWYFTSDGESRGPVTFAELRTMAANSVLDPRLDLVWKKGMSDWQQAGRIDRLFERNAARRTAFAGAVGQAPGVAALRSSALAATLASRDLRWPGSGRMVLLLGGVLFAVIWEPALSFASPYLLGWLGDVLMGKLIPWAPYVPWLVWVHLVLGRLANLGMSRWWVFAAGVPFLNLWVAFRCLVCPAGYAYHKRMDAAGAAVLASVVLFVTGAWFMVAKQRDTVIGDRLWRNAQTVIHGAVQFAGLQF